MWKVLHSKKVLTHPSLTLIEEELLLPSGQTVNWLRHEDTGTSVAVLAKDENGKFLLIREYSYPQQEFLLDVPGGFVPHNEDPETGAKREFEEETGYQVKILEPLGTYLPNRRRSNTSMQIYLGGELVEAKQRLDTTEQIDVEWYSEEDINQLIRSNKIVTPRLLCAWCYYTLQNK